jgi:hypothetical protein
MSAKPPRLDLNPSSAERWTTCTASPHFLRDNADKLPPSGSRFSEEGTTAHAVAAATLLDTDIGPTPTPVDEDMLWHGWNYAEYVNDLRAPQGMLLVEQKLGLWYMPGRNAIVDAAVSNPTNLHVVDYKYGEGVAVSPENNLQAVIYAKSVGNGLNLAEDFPVFIHIYQPRGRNAADGPAHVWETTWGEIDKLAAQIAEKAFWILAANPPQYTIVFAPSEKACQWCQAKGFCAARQAALTSDIEALSVIDSEPKSFPLAEALSDEQIAAVLQHGTEIVKWVNGVESYALERMKAGYKYPGHKLVMSRGGNRKWTDEQKATELLLSQTVLRRDEIVEEKLIGPASVEKLLGKRKMSVELTNLVVKPPGYPTIAPVDDSREEITNVMDEIEVV